MQQISWQMLTVHILWRYIMIALNSLWWNIRA